MLIDKLRLSDMELIKSWYPQGIASKAKEDAARRDEQITELLSEVHDDPARIYQLLHLQHYGVADQADFYFELRTLLTEALDQLDHSGDYLLQVALSPDISWYVRRQAVYFLKGRRINHLILRLMPLLEETGLQGEIRAAVATALGQQQIYEAHPLLLNLYRSLSSGDSQRLGGWTYAEADLLEALGYLGEAEVLRPLLSLQYHPYKSRRLSGQRGLQQLIRHLGGLEGALALLDNKAQGAVDARLARLATGEANDAVRRWATEQLAALDSELTIRVLCERLADPSWMVAHAAIQKILELPEPPVTRLKAILEDTHLMAPNTRLWAAYGLLKLGETVSPELLGTISGYPLALEPQVTPEVRRAILQFWARDSEPGTEVGWLVEAQTLPDFNEYTPPFEQLRQELSKRGLNVSGPLYCGELYRQGRGTFWVLQSRSSQDKKLYFYTLYLTLLGPFAHLNVLASEDETANSADIPFNNKTPEETRQLYREAIEAAGLTWLDETVTSYVFPGLNIYFFGSREPLPVNDLLFYWQD